jgi:hypothetical protein
MTDGVTFDPHAPHSIERTRALTDAVRALDHDAGEYRATALPSPSTAYELLGSLADFAYQEGSGRAR